MASTLISPANLLSLTDRIGLIYNRLVSGVDNANQEAQSLLTDLATAFAVDPGQENEWFPFVRSVYQSVSATNAAGQSAAFGSLTVPPGGFGKGFGLVNRASVFQAALNPLVANGVTVEIAKYGPAVAAGMVDLLTFAAYYNNATPFSCLYSPDLAAAYWYAYRQAKQLDVATIPGGSTAIAYPPVFAPQGIALATGTITGANAVTLSANTATNWPSANGYGSPAPTKTGPGYDRGAYAGGTTYNAGDAVTSGGIGYISLVGSNTGHTPASSPSQWAVNTYGNNVYLGAMPVAQWFAPVKSAQSRITTTINGTATLTVTAPAYDSGGTLHASRTFTVVIDNQTAGTITQLTPTNAGDRMSGVPSGITVAGTATAGIAVVETGTPERTIL